MLGKLSILIGETDWQKCPVTEIIAPGFNFDNNHKQKLIESGLSYFPQSQKPFHPIWVLS